VEEAWRLERYRAGTDHAPASEARQDVHDRD
jgi:hypothetical protein